MHQCVTQRGKQGDEQNYIEGYIEAASEKLAAALVEKKMYGKRDTLVLPIVYNARHSVELVQKFAINRLFAAAVLKSSAPMDHDIIIHWRLSEANLGDQELRQHIAGMAPFVNSLARIDDDGKNCATIAIATRRRVWQPIRWRTSRSLATIWQGFPNLSQTYIIA
jgi:hypothetical protein